MKRFTDRYTEPDEAFLTLFLADTGRLLSQVMADRPLNVLRFLSIEFRHFSKKHMQLTAESTIIAAQTAPGLGSIRIAVENDVGKCRRNVR